MPVFQKNKFPSKGHANTFAARYRAAMAKHPFALFGLPFLAVIIGGSFVLTPATAIRYERHDRKVRQMTREEELNVGKGRRKVDIREEYYVSLRWPVADEQCFEIPTSNDFVSETRGQGPGQLGTETGEAAQGRNRWNLVIVPRLGNDWAESGHGCHPRRSNFATLEWRDTLPSTAPSRRSHDASPRPDGTKYGLARLPSSGTSAVKGKGGVEA